jgi:DNA-binding transcriptional MerR regulator
VRFSWNKILIMALTLKDLAKKHKIPYSSLARWVDQGLIEPQGRTGRSGSVIILNEKNVREIENLIRLRKGGLSLQRARHLMEDLRAAGYNPLSKGLFVVIGKREGRVLRISENRKAAREVAGPYRGQAVMVELLPDGM